MFCKAIREYMRNKKQESETTPVLLQTLCVKIIEYPVFYILMLQIFDKGKTGMENFGFCAEEQVNKLQECMEENVTILAEEKNG